MATRPSNTAPKLGGVSLFYDRRSASDLGKGAPVTLTMTQGIEDQLDRCFNELWNICPNGKPNKIFTAGAWTNKPGMHGAGRAFDLDGFEWSNRKFIVLEDGRKNGDRKFYFGIEAVLRKHFGIVLDYLYNSDHYDHFHIDDGVSIDFDTSARSKVLFLQGALVFVFGLSVGSTGIDGRWGDNTKNALNQALSRLGITGSIFNRNVWLDFLTQTAKEAFGTSVISRNVTITQPTPLSQFPFENSVHFEGTADPEVTTIKLIAEDKFHFDTVIVNSGKWATDYKFYQAGQREIVIKGFDNSDRQVSRTTVDILLQMTSLADSNLPEKTSNLLGSVVINTMSDSTKLTQITQPFQGAKAIFKLNSGELYIEGNLYITANGSPNVLILDPIHGVLQTSLKYLGLTGQEQFVNSEKISYFLLPKDLYEPFAINLGDIGVFIYNNKIAYAVFADVGESHKSAGGSIALANVLGNDAVVDNIINRGISDNVICIVFPKSGDGTPQTPDQIQQKGEELFKRLGGNSPM